MIQYHKAQPKVRSYIRTCNLVCCCSCKIYHTIYNGSFKLLRLDKGAEIKIILLHWRALPQYKFYFKFYFISVYLEYFSFFFSWEMEIWLVSGKWSRKNNICLAAFLVEQWVEHFLEYDWSKFRIIYTHWILLLDKFCISGGAQ